MQQGCKLWTHLDQTPNPVFLQTKKLNTQIKFILDFIDTDFWMKYSKFGVSVYEWLLQYCYDKF